MSYILDGEKLRQQLFRELAQKIRVLSCKPKLVIIQVGDLKESNEYIEKKKEFGQNIGAVVMQKKYSEQAIERDIINDITTYNADPTVHGIMIQLPLPKQFSTHTIIEAISPEKDVDGLTSKNTKLLFDNIEGFIPATTKGILTMLQYHQVEIEGKNVVMVSESQLVGRPTALAFLNRKATVTICHIHTKNLEKETGRADILITATGKPHLITDNHVRENQIIIDVGITVTENGEIIGDVDFKAVKDMVQAITPVPGGVGPMTVFSLFENLAEAALSLNN